MGVVIDTSAIVEMERSLDRGAGVPNGLADEPVVVPAIVWAEALVGVRLASSAVCAARRRAHLEAIRIHAEIVAFTAEVAEHYADIYAELSDAGSPVPQNDLAVAATARFLDAAVLVGPHDEAHFSRVPGLVVRVLRFDPET